MSGLGAGFDTRAVEQGAEQDLIDLSAYGFNSFNDIQINSAGSLTGWAVIQLSATDSIMLAGVYPNQLTASDFIL